MPSPLTITRAAVQPKEQDVSKSIQAYLDKRRIYNDRLNSGKVMVVKEFRQAGGQMKRYETWLQLCRKGTPDRFAILRGGKLCFIEVKKYGKKPTAEQLAVHQELRRAGAVVLVADSIDGFMAQFEEIEPLQL